MIRNPGKPWRVKSDDRGDFDELCVGKWLHLERMNHRTWFLSVGAQNFYVTVDQRGGVVMTDIDAPSSPPPPAASPSPDSDT